MDRDTPLVSSVTSGTGEENQVDSEPDNIDVLYVSPQLNNSFEDLEEELGKKGLLSHVAESTDGPLEVMGIENTW
jgi:cellobiose-specific phosphotransferase system component IIB